MKKVAAFLIAMLAVVNLFAQENIYVYESDANGFHTKTTFYDDGKEVVAFDAQFTEALAEQAISFLKSKTKSPIKYLVVTHPNPDKFNGIPAFQKIGAQVVMSDVSSQHLEGVHAYKKYYFVNMAKMFTEETYPALPKADILFSKKHQLKLANGGKVDLLELEQSGISTNQTVAYIKSVNALIVGDLVHHKAHAWLEGPIVNGKSAFSNEKWMAVLQRLEKEFPAKTTVYGGRGEAVALKVAAAAQVLYLQKATQLAQNYLNALEGSSLADKKSKVDYAALQAVFEKEFPDYKLGYMIAYGAYGMVASL